MARKQGGPYAERLVLRGGSGDVEGEAGAEGPRPRPRCRPPPTPSRDASPPILHTARLSTGILRRM